VLRTLGKGPGVTVLLIDVLKGAASLAFVYLLCAQPAFQHSWGPQFQAAFPWLMIACGSAAILGHSKSVWLNFTGGKSVATSLGILLLLDWRMALAALGVFALTLSLSRWVSLSSILATVSVPIWLFYWKQPFPYLLFGVVGGIYVIWRHATNIQRIIAGTEPKLGSKEPVENLSPDEVPATKTAP
jgi:acyl phosphate:glycerol-3-phosphate acyltransferase